VRGPLVGSRVEDGDTADCEFGDALGERGLGADGAKESVPTVGDGGIVQQGEVERDQRAGSAASGDATVDVLHILGCICWGRRGGVGDTHAGYGGGCKGAESTIRTSGVVMEVGFEFEWRVELGNVYRCVWYPSHGREGLALHIFIDVLEVVRSMAEPVFQSEARHIYSERSTNLNQSRRE